MMSLLFPTLSTARASKNLSTYEYTPGGQGLTWDTLWMKYHNYRVATYFAIMAYALVLHFAIGMLFEKYGCVSDLIKSLQKKVNPVAKSVESAPGCEVREEESFTAPKEEVLEIQRLVKTFKGANDQKEFIAVDNLSLTLYQN
jgi:hypothetical protein